MNVPIKHGTARRLGLRQPEPYRYFRQRWMLSAAETHLWPSGAANTLPRLARAATGTGWALETTTVGQEVV